MVVQSIQKSKEQAVDQDRVALQAGAVTQRASTQVSGQMLGQYKSL